MKKRIISLVFILAMLFSMATVLSLGASASAGVEIVCSVSEQTETEVTVDVSIVSNVGFGFLELTPSFPAALSLTSVTNGALISDFTKGNQYIWVGDDDITATGTLCTLTFAIPTGTADGEYPISFVVQLCGNYNEEEVDVNMTPCNVTIGGAPTPELPTADASVISYQVSKGTDGEFSFRLIAGLNSLEYEKFGYEVMVTTKDGEGNDVVTSASATTHTAYSAIYGGNVSYSIKEYFGFEYACLGTIKGLAADSDYTKLEISTYVVSDGEKVYGNGATLIYTGETDANGYPALSFDAE